MPAPTSCWSTPAASSIRAKEESLEAIGEAIAENGRVIVTGCMGKEAERHPRPLPAGARDHRRRSNMRRSSARSTTPRRSRPRLSQPGARSRAQAHPAPLQLSEDLRGLQPPLRLLHHPARCAATSSAAAPTRSCARPRSWSRRARRSCWSSARTPRPTASTCKHAAWPWKGGEVRAHMTDLARELGKLGRLGAAPLCLSLSARRPGHPADGRGAGPPLSRHPLPACQPRRC